MSAAPLLRAERVGRSFGEVHALHDVALDVRAGETTVVMGASGSGKSTLLRLLGLLDAPTAGRVLLEGREVPPTGAAWLEAVRRIGLVQQRPGLLRATTVENVAFPLRGRGVARRAAEQDATRWLDRLGLASKADARASTLSGGEAQRTALARALVARPDVLLLDEATNQLDGEATRLVEAILREERARGCALVLVSHDVRQARRLADRFLFLVKGRAEASGPRAMLDSPTAPALATFLEYA